MPVVTLSHEVKRTPRVLQLSGLFDLPPTERQEQTWNLDLDLTRPWNVGLVVGPSGSGKSTVARALWSSSIRDEHSFTWPADESVVDAFPKAMAISDITELLSSVGFSSPPAWLRPFRLLSNGERFRVLLARMLAEPGDLVVCDEFTSVVDRTVAQVGSSAVARTVRNRKLKFIAVTCHEDVEDWLQPDWVLRMPTGEFARRSLRRRPDVDLKVVRCAGAAWECFRHHHYLDHDLNPSAICFLALWHNRPCAFSAWLPLLAKGGGRREHRTVCLPDYQGVGIGNALSAWCASLWKALGHRATSTTSHPGMIQARNRSPLWALTRKPTIGTNRSHNGIKHAFLRATASFEYVGPPLDPLLARRMLS
jgi:ABC-type lipoprotein export system ATPase subunit